MAASRLSTVSTKAVHKNTEPKVLVFDLLATQAPRRHELVDKDGVIAAYDFQNSFEGVPVPTSAALRLVGKEGWRVATLDGKSDFKYDDRAATDVELDANQTIATYDELTKEALLARAMTLQPSNVDLKGMQKAALVQFLVDSNTNTQSAHPGLGVATGLASIHPQTPGERAALTESRTGHAAGVPLTPTGAAAAANSAGDGDDDEAGDAGAVSDDDRY